MKKENPKCTNCFDKGFSTEYKGAVYGLPDFESDGNKRFKVGNEGIKINYCRCAKGKRMKYRAKQKYENTLGK